MSKLGSIILKVCLLIVIIGFALINYRIFTFSNGFSTTKADDKSVVEIISDLANTNKVEYYNNIFAKDDYVYIVYIEGDGESYLLKATQNEINSFKTIGVFSSNFSPNHITPIPFYIEIIVAIAIIAIPFTKRKKKR